MGDDNVKGNGFNLGAKNKSEEGGQRINANNLTVDNIIFKY